MPPIQTIGGRRSRTYANDPAAQIELTRARRAHDYLLYPLKLVNPRMSRFYVYRVGSVEIFLMTLEVRESDLSSLRKAEFSN